jgi:hypothetical protein
MGGGSREGRTHEYTLVTLAHVEVLGWYKLSGTLYLFNYEANGLANRSARATTRP